MAKESVHAKRLRELGFRKVPSELGKKVVSALKSSGITSRNSSIQPNFIPDKIQTFATDETGQAWKGPGKIDLSPLGFRNIVEWYGKTQTLGKKPN